MSTIDSIFQVLHTRLENHLEEVLGAAQSEVLDLLSKVESEVSETSIEKAKEQLLAKMFGDRLPKNIPAGYTKRVPSLSTMDSKRAKAVASKFGKGGYHFPKAKKRPNDPKVVALVIKMHEEEGRGFRDIAAQLIARKISTVTGVRWSADNARKLYLYATKRKTSLGTKAAKATKSKPKAKVGKPSVVASLKGRYMGLMHSVSKGSVKKAKEIYARGGIVKAIAFLTTERARSQGKTKKAA